MKILALVGFLCFPMGFAINAFADDHTPEQNNAIKAFAFEGIGLGATYPEIKAKYPDLEFIKDESDAKVGLAAWKTYSPKAANIVYFYLFNGKVYELKVFYGADTLHKYGGYDSIYEKLVAKYGKEDKNPDDEDYVCNYIWQFYDADKYLNFHVFKKSSTGVLDVVDKSVYRQMTAKKKANADVGF